MFHIIISSEWSIINGEKPADNTTVHHIIIPSNIIKHDHHKWWKPQLKLWNMLKTLIPLNNFHHIIHIFTRSSSQDTFLLKVLQEFMQGPGLHPAPHHGEDVKHSQHRYLSLVYIRLYSHNMYIFLCMFLCIDVVSCINACRHTYYLHIYVYIYIFFFNNVHQNVHI